MIITDEMRTAVETALGPVRNMPVLRLNAESIGDHVIRLIAVSTLLGHAEIRNSLCYIDESQTTPETEFVRDILTLNNAELVAKWFDGREGAVRYANVLQSSAFDSAAG